MDALIQKSIQQVQRVQKSSTPWQNATDQPWQQPYHVYSTQYGHWTPINTSAPKSPSTGPTEIRRLALYSWNIDFMLPFADSRMGAAVEHLQSLVTAHPSPASTTTVIFFAECLVSDLKLLAAHPWIQETFHMTDVDETFWQSGHYGTTTLVDKRVSITNCFRVHYSQTRMERDGLFVDLDSTGNVLRLCNTHLESLALEPAYRPPQLALCAQYMNDQTVTAAILAGDLNAIQDFDRTLHSANGLKDAYLELGGEELDSAGHTWGQQTSTKLREQFGTSRMDKVLFCGERLRLKAFERFGAGVEVGDAEERQEIVELGFEKGWITDHLGIKAVFEMKSAAEALL